MCRNQVDKGTTDRTNGVAESDLDPNAGSQVAQSGGEGEEEAAIVELMTNERGSGECIARPDSGRSHWGGRLSKTKSSRRPDLLRRSTCPSDHAPPVKSQRGSDRNHAGEQVESPSDATLIRHQARTPRGTGTDTPRTHRTHHTPQRQRATMVEMAAATEEVEQPSEEEGRVRSLELWPQRFCHTPKLQRKLRGEPEEGRVLDQWSGKPTSSPIRPPQPHG